MVAKILGITGRKTGTGKKSGKPYDGYFVYFSHKDMNVTGDMAESFMYSEQMRTESNYLPAPGDTVEIVYGRFGVIESVRKQVK